MGRPKSTEPKPEKVVVEPVKIKESDETYQDYLRACEDLAMFEEAVEGAKSRKSAAVEMLAVSHDNKPLAINGAVLQPMSRKYGESTTWFFRNKTEK